MKANSTNIRFLDKYTFFSLSNLERHEKDQRALL